MLHFDTVETVTPPEVTDNSGAVASFQVINNLNRPITQDVNITWMASDYAGNAAEPYVVEVHLKGTSSECFFYL